MKIPIANIEPITLSSPEGDFPQGFQPCRARQRNYNPSQPTAGPHVGSGDFGLGLRFGGD
jgi:hypothetical protein